MNFRSIGFIPLLTTVAMGGLFILKFQKEATETEFTLRLQELIDERSFDSRQGGWSMRKRNYLQALMLLDEASKAKVKLEPLIEGAAKNLDVPSTYRPALMVGLLRNLEIAQEYDLFSPENSKRIEAGEELKIGAGGFDGEMAVISNTVPHRYSPEIEMRFANLLIKPESIVKRYPDRISEGALLVMTACRDSEWMSQSSYDRTLRILRSTGMGL